MDPHESTETSDRRRTGQVVTDAAEVYEDFFVPALFGQFAGPLLDAAGVSDGHTVLDVGCGTGIVARTAVDRVRPGGAVIGIDPNDGMLSVARRCSTNVDWRHGVAESLPLPDAHVDRTVSQFAAMFFEDPGTALNEILRVTRRGGRIAVATWAEVERSPGYAAMVLLLDEQVGTWAAEALLAPFTIGTEQALASMIGDIGRDVSVTTTHGIARFASIDDWLHTEIRGWTLAGAIDDDAFDELLAVARERLAEFATPDGAVAFEAPAIFGVIEV